MDNPVQTKSLTAEPPIMQVRNSIAIFAAAVLLQVLAPVPGSPVQAETIWNGNTPSFASDREARQARLDAEREARRKQYPTKPYPAVMEGGGKPDIAPEKPEVVSLSTNEEAGTIIVDTAGRRLFYVLKDNHAYMYPISVGRDGFRWTGTERISRTADWPTWTPPPEMRRRQPYLPRVMKGGVNNPLGAKALYLGSSIYRIHGTSNERSIGRASSSGCFRMLNKHVLHLSTLAKVGTKVKVMKAYDGTVGMPSLAFWW